ncbi:unnamed protein product, partial [Porites lobata]
LRCSEQNTLLLHIHNSGQLLASTSGLVDEPTRDQNTLDLVLTTNVDLIGNVVVAFNKADWSHLRSLFQYSPRDPIFSLAGEDINDDWTACKDIFFAIVDDCIPKYRQKKRLTAPWIT